MTDTIEDTRFEETFKVSDSQDSNEWIRLALEMIDKLSTNSTRVHNKIQRLSVVEALTLSKRFKKPSSRIEFEDFRSVVDYSVNVYNLTKKERDSVSDFVNFALSVSSRSDETVSIDETKKNIKSLVGSLIVSLDEG